MNVPDDHLQHVAAPEGQRPEFGLALTSRLDSPADYDLLFEQLSAVADVGVDLLMIADKHGDDTGLRSNAVLMGAILGQRYPVRSVGLLYLATEWPRYLFLETSRTIADLASRQGTNAFFAVALGRVREAPTAAGGNQGTRVAQLEAHLEAIRTDHVTRNCELWIPAERGSALNRAALMADTWLANAHFTLQELTAQVAHVHTEASGRQRPLRMAVRRDIVCAASDREANRLADEALAGGYRGGSFPRSAMIVGGPRTCRSQVEDLLEIGFSRVLVRSVLPGARGVEMVQRFFSDVAR